LLRVVSFGFQTSGFRTRQALIELGHDVAPAVTHRASEHHGIPVHLNARVDAATCAGGCLNDRA